MEMSLLGYLAMLRKTATTVLLPCRDPDDKQVPTACFTHRTLICLVHVVYFVHEALLSP